LTTVFRETPDSSSVVENLLSLIFNHLYFDKFFLSKMDKLIERNLTSEETEEFTETLVDYVRFEGEGIHKDSRLVGTTEVLEGLFWWL
jgi:hypothetical protein